MKRNWLRITGILAILAAALSAVIWWAPREPKYEGKPLSYWVEQLWSRPEAYNDSQTAIHAIGPKAIPFLMAQARRQDSLQERAYRFIWPKLPGPLQSRVHQPQPISYELHRKIGFVLGQIGQPALPTVLAGLQDRNEGIRLVAVEALQMIAPKSDSAVKLAAKLLTDSNSLNRIHAAFALGAMKPNSGIAVPSLIGALGDSDVGPNASGRPGTVFVRAHAARVLGELGPQAKAAVPALQNLLSTGDSYTRQQAAVALWRIGRETNSIWVLIAELKQAIQPGPGLRVPPPGTTCELCLKAFGEMGPQAKAAEPVIREAIKMLPRMESRGVRVQEMIKCAQVALEKIDVETPAQFTLP